MFQSVVRDSHSVSPPFCVCLRSRCPSGVTKHWMTIASLFKYDSRARPCFPYPSCGCPVFLPDPSRAKMASLRSLSTEQTRKERRSFFFGMCPKRPTLLDLLPPLSAPNTHESFGTNSLVARRSTMLDTISHLLTKYLSSFTPVLRLLLPLSPSPSSSTSLLFLSYSSLFRLMVSLGYYL